MSPFFALVALNWYLSHACQPSLANKAAEEADVLRGFGKASGDAVEEERLALEDIS